MTLIFHSNDYLKVQNHSVINHGLFEYFQSKQLPLYPLEMFSESQHALYTPVIGEVVKYKTNPAMNKGTAVFTSGFWRDGLCQNIKDNMSRGKIFVVKDLNTNYLFELNRYQIRPCK